MKQLTFDWNAEDKYSKLKTFRLEVNNVLSMHYILQTDKVVVVKNWLGRKGLQCNNGWNWSKDLNKQIILHLADKLLQANMAASSGLRENVYPIIFFAKMLVYIILLYHYNNWPRW